jgi:hypothetical protein
VEIWRGAHSIEFVKAGFFREFKVGHKTGPINRKPDRGRQFLVRKIKIVCDCLAKYNREVLEQNGRIARWTKPLTLFPGENACGGF